MLLRSRGLGAALVQGIYQAYPPTPGTTAAALGVTFSPLGQSPRPLFTPGPMTIDYAFPTVPPVPLVATLVDQAMQPMSAPSGPGSSGGGNAGGSDPNMPQPLLHGVPPSLAPFPADNTPPPADSGGAAVGQSSLSPEELTAIQTQNLTLQAGNQQQQRKIWTMVLAGGAIVGGALLLTRRG